MQSYSKGIAVLTTFGSTLPRVGRLIQLQQVIINLLMNGIEATYELRHFAPETKVVLISSHYTPEEAAILARLFGDGTFVTRPPSL